MKKPFGGRRRPAAAADFPVGNRFGLAMLQLTRYDCTEKSNLRLQTKLIYTDGYAEYTTIFDKSKSYLEPNSPGMIVINQVCRW